jgi:hypothetical protein
LGKITSRYNNLVGINRQDVKYAKKNLGGLGDLAVK